MCRNVIWLVTFVEGETIWMCGLINNLQMRLEVGDSVIKLKQLTSAVSLFLCWVVYCIFLSLTEITVNCQVRYCKRPITNSHIYNLTASWLSSSLLFFCFLWVKQATIHTQKLHRWYLQRKSITIWRSKGRKGEPPHMK